jgi:L-seryl-tRNA(Ser) seleniumtransferase
VSREEIIAFIKALECYLVRDHEADAARWEAQIGHIREALAGLPHLTMERQIRSETYTVPLLAIRIGPEAGITGEEAIQQLRDGEPRIIVGPAFGNDGLLINPHMLQPGQERIVADRCRAVLAGKG